MKCCGHERSGKFCSDCGKPLSDDPLARLLAHCHTQIKKQGSQAETFKRKAKSSGREYDEKEARRSAEAAKEWQVRAEALTEILQQRAGSYGH